MLLEQQARAAGRCTPILEWQAVTHFSTSCQLTCCEEYGHVSNQTHGDHSSMCAEHSVAAMAPCCVIQASACVPVQLTASFIISLSCHMTPPPVGWLELVKSSLSCTLLLKENLKLPAGFAQWKAIIHLLLGCEEAPIRSHVQLFIKALRCLLCQLQHSLTQVTTLACGIVHNHTGRSCMVILLCNLVSIGLSP